MKPHDRIRLQHALDAAETAIKFAAGRSREDLDADDMLLFALVRAIEILGDAMSKVSNETRAEINLPWSSIIGMRIRPPVAKMLSDKQRLSINATHKSPIARRRSQTVMASIRRQTLNRRTVSMAVPGLTRDTP